MAKAFSLLPWNVEHFGKAKIGGATAKPVGPIFDKIAEQKADVIAIYELVGKTVFDQVVTKFSYYNFHITEGPQTQEILVGVKRTLTAFFTQKTEFKSGASALRPGALLTIAKGGHNYSLCLLHLRSLTEPKRFNLHDDMTTKAIGLRKTMNKAHTNRIFLARQTSSCRETSIRWV